MLVDSHCHLDYFTEAEIDAIVARAREAGVGRMVTIGTRVGQAAQCQGQHEAHGGGLVAIGARRHVMQARALQALRGEMTVDLREVHDPG